MTNVFHLYHLVQLSPWPLIASTIAGAITSSCVFWFKTASVKPLVLSLFALILLMAVWWRDTSRESALVGDHPSFQMTNLKSSMILFILSEVFFFMAFFWTFLHSSLTPTGDLGMLWPPLHVFPLNPFQVPLLNTLILLSSGVTVTWSHHALINNNPAKMSLLLTCFLGLYFTFLQALEYVDAKFSLSDAVYGSTFFVATGFHGLHVIIGTLFLVCCLGRINYKLITNTHHVGYEMAIWYWHFVDVVWLFLFSLIYWWGF